MLNTTLNKDAAHSPVGVALFGLATLIACGLYSISLAGIVGLSQVLWAVALWTVGTLAGFLFAIPRVLQASPPKSNASGTSDASDASGAFSSGNGSHLPIERKVNTDYQLAINTNLEEISDWLTKIIIGTTLIQLKDIPDQIVSLADLLTSNMPKNIDHRGYATAIIVVFSVLGFLFGYLVTRLYIQRILADVERSLVLPETVADLERRLEMSKLAEQTLRSLATSDIGTETVSNGMARLQQLVSAYFSVSVPDWAARVQEKDRLADEMVRIVKESDIGRDTLIHEENEGMFLAFAATSLAFPERDDLSRLLKIAGRVKRLHVKYRIVLALSKLLESGYIPAEEKGNIHSALDVLERGSDGPLKRRIDSLRAQISPQPASR